jgi:hypothetical protein
MRTRVLAAFAAAIVCFADSAAYAQFPPLTNIAYAKRDVAPQDYFADDTNGFYRVRGRVTSPHFSTNRSQFFIQDTDDDVGIQVVGPSQIPVSLFTEVEIVGMLAQSNGLRLLVTEFAGDIAVTDPVTSVVAAVSGTISDLLADAERYEGTYVVISNVYRVTNVWASWNGNANVAVTDQTGRINMRLEGATDIDGQLEPTNAFHLYGIFSQFDSSTTPTGGYQVLPRFYTDIVQDVGQQMPEIVVVNSNTFSVAVGQQLSVTLLGLDRNAEDVLVISTNDAPEGCAVTNLPNREARLTWTPAAGYANTTNKIILEVTDGTDTGTVGLDIFVLSEELANIRLNEVHWAPASSIAGDANEDGVRNAITDEFIEIVNNNATDVDITGWVIKYGANTFFTFPPTVLTGKTAVVVFGGGVPAGLFGHSIVYAPSPNWTGLGNSPGGNAVSLWTDGGAQVFSYNYGSFGAPGMSATRSPDFTGDFVLHTGVVASLLWSPGRMANGKYFEGIGQANATPLVVPIAGRSVGVGKGIVIPLIAYEPDADPITMTVSNAPDTASFIDNGDGTATLAYTGLVAEAGMSFAISVYASDGIDDASSRTFNLKVLESKYDGLVINEYLLAPRDFFDANSDGAVNTSQDEYVEIVNNTTGAVDMVGMMLYDDVQLRHRFTSQVVPQGGSIVVFGGGSIANFRYQPAQLASTTQLGLNNGTDSITLYTPATDAVDRVEYGADDWSLDVSLTRFPDVTGEWANHYIVTTNALRGSPGRRVNGEPFIPNQPPFFSSLSDRSLGESNSLEFAVRAMEVDGEPVTLTASNLPPSAQFFGTNDTGFAAGMFVWTSAVPAGVYTTSFYAVDKDGVTSTAVVITVVGGAVSGGSVWINEFHYDNTGTDVGEFIEVAGTAGIDLGSYALLLYNGGNAMIYRSNNLTGVIPDEGCGFGAAAFFYPTDGIQNGSPDGFALVKDGTGVIQFLSYEGTFTAVGGAADGMLSVDVGVSEPGTTPIGFSLQLTGTGAQYAAFTWVAPRTNSAGFLNVDQEISPCGADPDTDGDGIPDWWEEFYYGGPTNAVATDLAANALNTVLEAFIADIDPTLPDAFFEIDDISGAGVRSVTFLSSTGRVYTFQFNDNLLDPDAWSNLVTDVSGTNTTTTLSDTNTPMDNRSYRVRVRVP